MISKENKLFVIVFIVFIFILFSTLVSGRIFREKIAEIEEKSTQHLVGIDWQQLYPANEAMNVLSSKVDDNSLTNDNSITKVYKKLDSGFTKLGEIGTDWAKNCYKYSSITAMGNFLVSYLLDSTVSSGGYTKLADGYWIKPTATKISLSAARESLSNYPLLKEWLDSKGIAFLYCFAPNKECVNDTEQLNGVISYTNENLDTYMAALEYYGIDYVDFREYIHKEELNHHSLYYKTDHHWTVETGLWATSIIEKRISNQGIFMQDVNEFGHYSSVVYEDAVFGSAGNTVTHAVEQSEDFEIYYPDFDTSFEVVIPDIDINITGSFADVFIDYEGIDYAMELGGGYAYEQILYGNRPYVKITNLKNTDGPKVLMIRDSFSLVVAPYLASSCSELILLDLRKFTGSVIECIDGVNPDIVMALGGAPQNMKLSK